MELPNYQNIGAAALNPGLENIHALCEALGNPHTQFPSILIGGTNGKGSVASMIAAAFTAAGYKTGLHTSPHLLDPRERTRINGTMIPQATYDDFLERIPQLTPNLTPSFFEASVAMAFHHFAQQKVDIAIVEVGMGGLTDATNLLPASLSILTNVSLDHTDWLGETLPEIAKQKAGIIKPGKTVLIGPMEEQVEAVIASVANEAGATLEIPREYIGLQLLHQDVYGQSFSVSVHGQTLLPELVLELPGEYQAENLILALGALQYVHHSTSPEFAPFTLAEAAIQQGMAFLSFHTGLIGRMTLLRQEPTVLADVGHNEAGVQAIAMQLAQFPPEKLHIVWGMVQGKAHEKVLNLLPRQAQYYFVQPDLPRAWEAANWQPLAKANGLNAQISGIVLIGYQQALQNALNDDVIFIGGSSFVVAEVLAFLNQAT